jgi:hypothetical protein
MTISLVNVNIFNIKLYIKKNQIYLVARFKKKRKNYVEMGNANMVTFKL